MAAIDTGKKLSGGDRRSIGNSNAVAKKAERSQDEFDRLIAGLFVENAVVRMRSADAAEKASQKNTALLAKHKSRILRSLGQFSQQEVCWHIALMLPRLALTTKEARRAADVLLLWARTSESKIVAVNALQGLWEISAKHPVLRGEVQKLVQEFLLNGSAALKARARKLLQ